MAISVTAIATGSSAATVTTVVITIPAGGVPAGACILVAVGEDANIAAGGSITDTAAAGANTYSSIVSAAPNNSQANGFGALWHADNVNALTSAHSDTITYTRASSLLEAAASAFYATGIATSSPVDTAVTTTATGSSAAPSVGPSGTPAVAGELFVAMVVSTSITTQSAPTFTQDTGNGWAVPFTAVNKKGTSSFVELNGGNQVNAGTGTITFAPTFNNPFAWAAFIIGLKPLGGTAQQGSAEYAGAGSLSALVTLRQSAVFTFSGAGGLSALVTLHEAAFANFNGSGSLSASTIQHGLSNATFAGTGSLSALVTLNEAAFAQFNGAGSLSASATLGLRAAAVFAGTGSLSALVSLGLLAAATFAGTGSLTVATQQAKAALATLNGAGSLSASALLAVAGFATFNGTGSLSAIVIIRGLISAQFNGSGSLSAVMNEFYVDTVVFQGAGSLTASAYQASVLNTVRAHLGAVGEFPLGQEQDIFPLFAQIAEFDGTGSMTVGSQQSFHAQAEFDGKGRMCVQAIRRIGRQGTTTNTVVQGPGPTKQKVVYGGGVVS